MEIVLIRGRRIVVDASLDAAALDRVVNVLVEMRPAEAHQPVASGDLDSAIGRSPMVEVAAPGCRLLG